MLSNWLEYSHLSGIMIVISHKLITQMNRKLSPPARSQSWWIVETNFVHLALHTITFVELIIRLRCFWQPKLGADENSWHLFKKSSQAAQNVNWLYLHVSDARSRFILILFWYVDWVTALTFYDSSWGAHFRPIHVAGTRSIETAYWTSSSSLLSTADPRYVKRVFSRLK